MPRQPRKRSEADIYHVIMRGEGRMAIFEDDEDRKAFLRMLVDALGKSDGSLLAWCLMSNHVHLAVLLPFEKLSRFEQGLNSGYAVYYNKRHDHVGHVFGGRYRSVPVDTDEQLLQVVRYIHLNPVKGGIAGSYEYEWSSYGDYMHGTGFTDTGFVLKICGSLHEFEAYHSSSLEEIASVEQSVGRIRLSDAEASSVARAVLGASQLKELAGMPKPERNAGIARLRRAGLSSRQVERLTGIGRGIVSRVLWQEDENV